MKSFRIMPTVEMYDTVANWMESFRFEADDFVLISKHVFEHDFKNYAGNAKIVFRSDYGKGEPNSDMMNALLKDFLQSGCKRIIAIGGGSVMDMAKILAVSEKADCLYTFQHPEELQHRYPLILVPTTCGSGSEVSAVSIVEMIEMQTKLGLQHDTLFADKAILIPSLLESISDFFLTTSAVDGLVHAIESYLSKRSNPFTRLFQEKAISLYIQTFKKWIGGCQRSDCYEAFMYASNMAGISFANTGTGCVHGISYPVSGVYHVTHGLANSIFLVEVLKMYDELEQRQVLIDLKDILAKELECNRDDAFQSLDKMVHQLLDIPTLSSIGMTEEEIVTFSLNVVKNQQRLMSNGYVNLNEEQIQEVYRRLY